MQEETPILIVVDEIGEDVTKFIAISDIMNTLRSAYFEKNWESVLAMILALQTMFGVSDSCRSEHPLIHRYRARLVAAGIKGVQVSNDVGVS